MKDTGEASHMIQIEILRKSYERMLCLSQKDYTNEVLERFKMNKFQFKKETSLVSLNILTMNWNENIWK